MFGSTGTSQIKIDQNTRKLHCEITSFDYNPDLRTIRVGTKYAYYRYIAI